MTRFHWWNKITLGGWHWEVTDTTWSAGTFRSGQIRESSDESLALMTKHSLPVTCSCWFHGLGQGSARARVEVQCGQSQDALSDNSMWWSLIELALPWLQSMALETSMPYVNHWAFWPPFPPISILPKVGSFICHSFGFSETSHSPLNHMESCGAGGWEQGWSLPKVIEGVTDLEQSSWMKETRQHQRWKEDPTFYMITIWLPSWWVKEAGQRWKEWVRPLRDAPFLGSGPKLDTSLWKGTSPEWNIHFLYLQISLWKLAMISETLLSLRLGKNPISMWL